MKINILILVCHSEEISGVKKGIAGTWCGPVLSSIKSGAVFKGAIKQNFKMGQISINFITIKIMVIQNNFIFAYK